MKKLIVGIGNIGSKYEKTKHNVGFMILNKIVAEEGVNFNNQKYGELTFFSTKNSTVYLLKPNTMVNSSGKSVIYWKKKLNIELQNLLIVVDDLSLPLGLLRLKSTGSHGGHNGLRDIEESLNTNSYSRLRFGIDKNFLPGMQAAYVLSPFGDSEWEILNKSFARATECIKNFCVFGVEKAMNSCNSNVF